MFAICLSLAAGTVGDHWIASDTHPVYNTGIQPLIRDATHAEHEELERRCAEIYDLIESDKELIEDNGWKARLGDGVKARLGDELAQLLLSFRRSVRGSLRTHEAELRMQTEMLRQLKDKDVCGRQVKGRPF